MGIEFLHTLKRMSGGILGWSLSLGALAVFLIPFYDTLTDPSQVDSWVKILNSMPKELMVFFGDMSDLTAATDFLSLEFFSYMPIVLGVYAVLIGAGMVKSDEENGRLDLILAHPISRTSLFFSRWLALSLAMVIILLVSWLVMALTLNSSATMQLTAGEVALAFVSLGAVMFFITGLTLFLSLALPARRWATISVGFYLAASFFITSLARLGDTLNWLKPLSVLSYYQSGDAMEGLNLLWVVGLLAATIVLVLLGWWLFLRRDVRVSGEGSWRKG